MSASRHSTHPLHTDSFPQRHTSQDHSSTSAFRVSHALLLKPRIMLSHLLCRAVKRKMSRLLLQRVDKGPPRSNRSQSTFTLRECFSNDSDTLPSDSDAFDSDLHHPSRRSSRPFRHLLNPPTTTPPALSVRPSSAAAPAKTNITASPWPRRRIRIPPARHLRCRPPSPTSPGRHLVPASSITNRTG